MVRDESVFFFSKYSYLRKREKEGSWKKLHGRKVGRWAMIIFHSTRRSELSL